MNRTFKRALSAVLAAIMTVSVMVVGNIGGITASAADDSTIITKVRAIKGDFCKDNSGNSFAISENTHSYKYYFNFIGKSDNESAGKDYDSLGNDTTKKVHITPGGGGQNVVIGGTDEGKGLKISNKDSYLSQVPSGSTVVFELYSNVSQGTVLSFATTEGSANKSDIKTSSMPNKVPYQVSVDVKTENGAPTDLYFYPSKQSVISYIGVKDTPEKGQDFTATVNVTSSASAALNNIKIKNIATDTEVVPAGSNQYTLTPGEFYSVSADDHEESAFYAESGKTTYDIKLAISLNVTIEGFTDKDVLFTNSSGDIVNKDDLQYGETYKVSAPGYIGKEIKIEDANFTVNKNTLTPYSTKMVEAFDVTLGESAVVESTPIANGVYALCDFITGGSNDGWTIEEQTYKKYVFTNSLNAHQNGNGITVTGAGTAFVAGTSGNLDIYYQVDNTKKVSYGYYNTENPDKYTEIAKEVVGDGNGAKVTIPVTEGNTYVFYGSGTKPRFIRIAFKPNGPVYDSKTSTIVSGENVYYVAKISEEEAKANVSYTLQKNDGTTVKYTDDDQGDVTGNEVYNGVTIDGTTLTVGSDNFVTDGYVVAFLINGAKPADISGVNYKLQLNKE